VEDGVNVRHTREDNFVRRRGRHGREGTFVESLDHLKTSSSVKSLSGSGNSLPLYPLWFNNYMDFRQEKRESGNSQHGNIQNRSHRMSGLTTLQFVLSSYILFPSRRVSVNFNPVFTNFTSLFLLLHRHD